jgi:sugar phosphate isomerase/epimerase
MSKRHSVIIAACLLTCGATFADEFAPEFFAFRNGVHFGTPTDNARTLKELGYAGVSQIYSGDPLAEHLAAYEAVGLRVLSISLDASKEAIPAEKVKPLANRDAMIELTIRKMTPTTIEAVRQTAAMAAELKMQVSLYPHHGFAVATIPQALDLIEKVNHPNLGVTFNLCHFLKNENPDDLEAILRKARPHLFSVTTNGADLAGKNWNTLIQPLDKGDFPQSRLLKILKALKFTGPVGLQCYGVKGDHKENLTRSMAAWQEALKAVQ